MQQLSAQDAMFLYLESAKNPMHIGGIYIFNDPTGEKAFDFEEIKTYLAQRLHLSRIFRQRLVEVPLNLGKPYWVEDPDFDLDYHLSHIGLPKPGGLAELSKLAAQIYNPPMARSRPLWRLTFVTGLDNIKGINPDASFAMIGQVHHAMIDGGSGVEIMASLLNMSPDIPKIKPPKKVWKPERIPTGMELLFRSSGKAAFSTPFKIMNLLKNAAPKILEDLGNELRKSLIKPPSTSITAPKTLLNVPVTGHKIFGGVDIPLAQIKAIKNAVEGAKVNDVILAACGGALRQYFIEKKKLPKKSMSAMAPISVRSKNETGAMGNRVSAMFVSLGTDITDPIKRLKFIIKKTQKSKTRGKAIRADQIMEMLPSQVSVMASRLYTKMGLSELHKPFFNLVVTNVPGPPFPLYMNGFQLARHYGLGAIFDGIGMMIIIFSYAGNVSICATSCKEIVPDIRHFAECIRQNMNELAKALDVPVSTEMEGIA